MTVRASSGLFRFPFVVFLTLSSLGAGLLSGVSSAAEPVQFRRDVAPILVQKCQACHEPGKAKGEYRVDTVAALLTPGRTKEKPIVPGVPSESLLVRLLKAKDPDDRMPQKDDPLPPDQIALIARWIEEGATIGELDPKQPLATLVGPGAHPSPPAKYPQPVPVLALAFSADGRELAVSGYHEVTIWNPDKGELLRRITNIAQQVQAIDFSPDGRWLVAASGTPGRVGEARLFETASGRLVRTLGSSGDLMLTACFSREGNRVAFAGADNALQLFDLGKNQLVFRTEQHADWIFSARFSPDEKHLVTASRDKTVRVVSTDKGELEQTYTGHAEPVFAAAFSADGKRVVSAGRDRKIHLWNTSEGKKLAESGLFSAEILTLLVRSNRVFTGCADGAVREHEVVENRLEERRGYSGHSDYVRSLALRPKPQGGGLLAAGSHDGRVCLWNLDTGGLELQFIPAPGHQDKRLSQTIQ